MESTIDTGNELLPQEDKPQFLKILCIFSFVSCGLWLIIYAFMSMCLGIEEQKVSEIFEQMATKNPEYFSDMDGVAFFHSLGLMGLMGLASTIVSAIGVIMMWQLRKAGFIVYAISELASNFIGMGMDMGKLDKGMGSVIFWVIIDLIFIAMYFVNLKHMKK